MSFLAFPARFIDSWNIASESVCAFKFKLMVIIKMILIMNFTTNFISTLSILWNYLAILFFALRCPKIWLIHLKRKWTGSGPSWQRFLRGGSHLINCTRTEEEEDFLRPGPYLIVENSDFHLSVFGLYQPWISGLHFFVSLISNKLWHFKFLLVFPF